jgi:CubicO group peptidase (beta-lactamase class C family)
VAVLQLQEAGVLSVGDPVVRWLPEFCLPGGWHGPQADLTPSVTLHDLLTHTAGLPPEYAMGYARLEDVRSDPDLAWMTLPPRVREQAAHLSPISTYEEFIERVASPAAALLAPPGELFSYSNEGYALLGAIVERASGVAFPDYVRRHITKPLGLTRTACLRPDVALEEPVAQRYARGTKGGRPGIYAAPQWWGRGRILGHTGMVSTVRDLLRYVRVFLNGGAVDGCRLLSAQSVWLMTARQVPIPTGGFYGYGVMIQDGYAGVRGRDVIFHGGGTKGVSAHIAFEPASGAAAVGLAGLLNAPTHLVTYGALNGVLGLPLEAKGRTFPELSLAPERLAEYAGVYRNEDAAAIKISATDGALVAETEELPPVRARPYEPDAFVALGGEVNARFLRDARGEIWAISAGLRVYRRDRPHRER